MAFLPIALLTFTFNVHGMEPTKKISLEQLALELRALTTMIHLVASLTESNQEVIDYIQTWKIERPLPCSLLKEAMAAFKTEEHWSHLINNEKNLTQPIKDALYQVGMCLEAKYIYLAEPWLLHKDRVLTSGELQEWKNTRIMLHKTIISEVCRIAHLFYPDHFDPITNDFMQ